MRRQGFFWLIGVILLLGLFFQYNRMDGFLHLFASVNRHLKTEESSGTPWKGAEEVAPDTYLIIYDPASVESLFLRHEAERMIREKKMNFQSIRMDEAVSVDPASVRGVLVATGRLDRVVPLDAVFSYVEGGGTAVFLTRLLADPSAPLREETLAKLGIRRIDHDGQALMAYGLTMKTDFLPGSKGLQVEGDTHYTTAADALELSDEAAVQVSDYSGTVPLIWQQAYGRGSFYAYNGSLRADKTGRGFLMSFLAHCGDDVFYPIVGCKIFFIDDFPSPIPEGYEDKIRSEYNLTTRDFYSRIWWPYMKGVAEREHVKYTGVIIESYGDQVEGPFKPIDEQDGRNALLVYGNDLLKNGGEMGIHGYNHQPLVPPGYQDTEPDYVPWQRQSDMEEAVAELNRYVHDAFPEYKFQVYVPPSNILSPEGKEAVKKAFPEIRVFSSLYDGADNKGTYYQEFSREENGIYDIPRITAGYKPKSVDLYAQSAAIASIGVFSHFVHPDELLYEESKDLTWEMMSDGLRDFLDQIDSRYGWLTPVTISESLPYFDSYFNLDYRVVRRPGELEIHCWHYVDGASFLLHSTKDVASAEGCTVQKAGDETYFVRLTEAEAHIYWKGQT